MGVKLGAEAMDQHQCCPSKMKKKPRKKKCKCKLIILKKHFQLKKKIQFHRPKEKDVKEENGKVPEEEENGQVRQEEEEQEEVQENGVSQEEVEEAGVQHVPQSRHEHGQRRGGGGLCENQQEQVLEATQHQPEQQAGDALLLLCQ